MMKIEKKQQDLLERFFRKEEIKENRLYAMVLFYLFVGLSFLLLFCPFAAYESRDDIKTLLLIPYLLYLVGMSSYSSIYGNYLNEKKRAYYCDLFRSLPVSKEQICLYKARRTAKVCMIACGIVLVIRASISISFFHTISIWDIVIPLLGHIGVPVGSCFLDLLFDSDRSHGGTVHRQVFSAPKIPYDTFEGVKVTNICGFCGKKAIPLALLGSEVTVFDISEDNKRYAMETAKEGVM